MYESGPNAPPPPVRDPEFFFVPCLWHADLFIFTYLHVPRKYHHLNLPECFPSQGLLWVEKLYIVTRAQINAQSTDSIQPRWPFDWTNFWVASHNFWPTCKYTVGDQEKNTFSNHCVSRGRASIQFMCLLFRLVCSSYYIVLFLTFWTVRRQTTPSWNFFGQSTWLAAVPNLFWALVTNLNFLNDFNLNMNFWKKYWLIKLIN